MDFVPMNDATAAAGGGDPEIEAAEAAAAKAAAEGEEASQEADEEDELDPKDAAALEKKERQMAKRGFDFAAKGGANAVQISAALA